MNPLVEALSKGKTGTEDYGGDLHTRKSTHISVPTEACEFHFSVGDLNMPAHEGERYVVCFDVVCSSSDNHDVRFKQYSRPYLQAYKGQQENDSSEGSLTEEKDIPMVRLQTQQEP